MLSTTNGGSPRIDARIVESPQPVKSISMESDVDRDNDEVEHGVGEVKKLVALASVTTDFIPEDGLRYVLKES